MRRLWKIIFSSVLLHQLSAQTVHTLPIQGLNGPNGFAMDKAGALYVANEPGKQVVKIINDSVVEKVLDCDSPCGLDFDNEGNLYVINFYSGVVLKKTNTSIDTFATGLDKPADIKWDGNENFYVSEYEKGTIKKINKQGQVVQFVSGFKRAFGLAFDEDRNLYVGDNATGEINKITSGGAVTVLGRIPGPVSYIAISREKKLYVPCFTCHKIYVIAQDGKTDVFAGNDNKGYQDGSLTDALFEDPNTVIISPAGDLYISEFAANRIRKITEIEK